MKYGFIGCGNMGGAIAKALAKSTTDFLVSDRSGKARKITPLMYVLAALFVMKYIFL